MPFPQSLIAFDRRDHRLTSLPDEVLIEPVMGCNLRCPMCPVTGLPHTMDGRTPVVMRMEVYRRILEQLADRPRHILLTVFGEPLLHPRIVEFVELAKRDGHHVHIISNGTKLTRELSGRLIDARLDVLTISIDGFSRETYARLRVGANLDRVLAGVRELADENARRGGGLRIELNYVVSPGNAGEQERFFREFSLLVHRINFHPITDHGAQFTLPDDLVPTEGDPRLIARLPLPAGFERSACVHLWKEMFISAEGRMMLCCNDFKLASALPNVMDQPLLDIWRDAIGAVRAQHVSGQFDHEPCRSCRVNMVPSVTPDGTRRSALRRAKRQRLVRGIVPASLLPPGPRRRRLEQESPFGYLDSPAEAAVVVDAIHVQGWALAAAGRTIARIEIRVDGHPLGCAELGAFRPDVGEAHPGEGHSFSGFSYLLDTRHLSNGPRLLDVSLMDDAERQVYVGARTIVVNN